MTRRTPASCSISSRRSTRSRRPPGWRRRSSGRSDRSSNPMIKNFVLDTNVLLHDPNALFKFQDNRVIVPITVIEELDHFKKDLNMLGRNARTVSKHIDRLRASGNLGEGVALEHGGVLRVALGSEGASLLPPELEGRAGDNQILGVALSARAREKDIPVVVVTKDPNLRIKADALGITAEDYESDRLDPQVGVL